LADEALMGRPTSSATIFTAFAETDFTALLSTLLAAWLEACTCFTLLAEEAETTPFTIFTDLTDFALDAETFLEAVELAIKRSSRSET